MKGMLSAVVVAAVACTLVLGGCGQKQAASSSEAIQTSETMKTVQEKADYLVQQAKAFFSEKKYQEAATTLQHVLSNVDANCQPAKDLLEKTMKAMGESARGIVQGVADQLSNFGKQQE